MYITDFRHLLDESGAIGPAKDASNATGQPLSLRDASSAGRAPSKRIWAATLPSSGPARAAVSRAASRTGRAPCGTCATARSREPDGGENSWACHRACSCSQETTHCTRWPAQPSCACSGRKTSLDYPTSPASASAWPALSLNWRIEPRCARCTAPSPSSTSAPTVCSMSRA
jgi:hypothetical protein